MERLGACVSRRARSRAAVAASVSAAVATERPADGACRDFHVVGYAAEGVAKIKAFFDVRSVLVSQSGITVFGNIHGATPCMVQLLAGLVAYVEFNPLAGHRFLKVLR